MNLVYSGARLVAFQAHHKQTEPYHKSRLQVTRHTRKQSTMNSHNRLRFAKSLNIGLIIFRI